MLSERPANAGGGVGGGGSGPALKKSLLHTQKNAVRFRRFCFRCKAYITQVFGAKNSEGSVRFKCEKLHKIPELGDMLEDWELSEMAWTYQRKCLSLANLAENLAAHSAFRGWTIKVDSTVKPYCSLYADFQVMALVEDLRANKKDVPPEDLLIGDNKSLAEMEKTYYRLDPKAKKHREQQLAGDDPATNDDW